MTTATITTVVAAIVSVAAAFTALFVPYFNARTSGYSKYVIGERQQWRESIRKLTIRARSLIASGQANSTEYDEVVSEMHLRLNPDDPYDRAIIDCLWRCKTARATRGKQERLLLVLVSRLLKHDWDRSVAETGLRWGKYPRDERRPLTRDDRAFIHGADDR